MKEIQFGNLVNVGFPLFFDIPLCQAPAPPMTIMHCTSWHSIYFITASCLHIFKLLSSLKLLNLKFMDQDSTIVSLPGSLSQRWIPQLQSLQMSSWLVVSGNLGVSWQRGWVRWQCGSGLRWCVVHRLHSYTILKGLKVTVAAVSPLARAHTRCVLKRSCQREAKFPSSLPLP